MTDSLDVEKARTQLSRLLKRVEIGEEFVITRDGQPVARLVPVQPPAPRRTPGLWRGQIVIGPDFDSVDAEIEALFEG